MDKRLLKVLKYDYAVEMDKKRNLKAIRTLYDMNEKEEYHIDEQTWNDLDLDKVYSKLDRNYSSLGEASLYSMLRNPLNDEKKLNKRREEIEYFKDNEEVRFNIMGIFFELGRDKKNSLLDMINEKLIESNKFKYYFYTITGKILPLILILTAIFVSVSAMLGLMAVTFVNIYINSKERDCRAQHKYDKHAKHGVTSTAAGYVYVKGSKFANLLDIIHKKTYRQESSHDQQNRDQK